ncbi:MAG: GDP-mannose 4,6-dehydratase, partial [Chloroflexota bacterium]
MRLLVTGGAGFIGSRFSLMAMACWPEAQVVVLDALTYAGNRQNLSDVENDPRYTFIHGNICDEETVARAIRGCTQVVN